jgi:predicted nuclease with RNAse H fold
MLTKPLTYVGVDPTAGRSPFTLAAINQDRKLIVLAACDMEEVLAFLAEQKPCVVAANAPPRPNYGIVRKNLEKQNLAAGQLRGSDLRQAESELRARGISVSPTPAHLEACPAWMQMGFELFRRLDEAGFKPYPTEQASQLWLETHPHAAFCALLGQIPLSKPTLEGRLQRQIALYEQGIDMKDPMEFFEEITRHKLLHGAFPMELVYTAEELDTLMAAYMAFCAVNCPQDTILIGDVLEGQIALPVMILKEKYT